MKKKKKKELIEITPNKKLPKVIFYVAGSVHDNYFHIDLDDENLFIFRNVPSFSTIQSHAFLLHILTFFMRLGYEVSLDNTNAD